MTTRVRLVCTADPGPGVVAALTDVRDRFRIVANAVHVVPPTAPLPKLPVGLRLEVGPGAAHHTVISTALSIEAFEDYARIAGTKLLAIDEQTTVRALEQQVTANAAYYRLARGI